MTIGRIPSVEGGIQPTIVDAKGDLITATAADTPARLAVGSNNQILMADSGQSTGLKWAGDWTAYTPTTYNITVGNGQVIARYRQIGKSVEVYIKFGLGSTSAVGTGPAFSLPVNNYAPTAGTGYWDKFGVGGNPIGYLLNGNLCYVLSLNASGTYLSWNTVTATNPTTWATNDSFTLNFSYEAA